MKIEIEIPQEFEEHFMRDKFEDALHRLSADAHLIAGNYEQETAIMLIKAFKESKTAYDVDKVVEKLKGMRDTSTHNIALNSQENDIDLKILSEISRYQRIIKIVKSGGIE